MKLLWFGIVTDTVLVGFSVQPLMDASMRIAYASTLTRGETFATVELKINFLRPVKEGLLIAEGWVVSGGRTPG